MIDTASRSAAPRRFGILPASAEEQAQKFHSFAANQAFQPLPPATGQFPFRLATADVGLAPAAGKRVFHAIGDSGGVKDPGPQLHVAAAMVADRATNAVEFFYQLGDVVYFNGDESEYGPQFYEPYAHYNAPIFAIPGNHDGDNSDNPSVPSLSAFVQNFCSTHPHLDPQAQETNRDTMDQPNVYWTLTDELVTIVGAYTNVPEGGQVDQDQVNWLVSELKAAPSDRALILALHHPPYSCDANHGGSARMGQLLDEVFAQAGRHADAVLSGHVHNYQRFTRTIGKAQVPYLVAGAGGYHNLHAIAQAAGGGPPKTPFQVDPDCTLDAFCADRWGFLRLTVSASALTGEYVAVAADGTATPGVDAFTLDLKTHSVT